MPFLKFLNSGEVVPKLFGGFHITWLVLVAMAIVTLCILWKKGIIEDVKNVLIATAVVLAIFEFYKQINVIFGDGTKIGYNFEHFPYRFNTMLIYLGIIGGMTKNKIHNSICSFIGTYLFFMGTFHLVYPQGLFSEVIGRNVQTMVSYGAMVVVGVFLWYTGEIKPEIKTFLYALPTYLMIYAFSITINVIPHLLKMDIEKANILNSCPICNLKESILTFVITSILAFAVVLLALVLKKLLTTDFDAEYGETDEIAIDIRKNTGLEAQEEGIFKFNGKVNTKKNTYLQTYYKNLNTNFGNNVEGSCGYVAASMLLSYYDTILYDKIIPRSFDKPSRSDDEPNFEESPGIRFFDHPEFHPETDADKISYKRYMELVNKNKSTYLHEALIAIGNKLRINEVPKDKNSSDFSIGTNNAEIEKVIKYYLKNIAEVNSSKYDIRECDNLDEISRAVKNNKPELVKKYSDQVRNYAIKNIKKGFPVLLGLNGEDVNGQQVGHAVIAYDYNKETDEIYCHMGWTLNGATHARPEHVFEDVENSPAKSFTIYKSARVLEFDEDEISHSHTDNYEVVVNGAIFYYCPDGSYTTCDDIVIDFDKTKQNCAIVSILGNYHKNQLYIPERYGNVNVAKIYEKAFANQKYLTECKLPFTLDIIEKRLFENDRALEKVIIPRSVDKIKRKAFYNCKKLKTIVFLGTRSEWFLVKKVGGWDRKTGNYVVSCTDGILIKHNENKDFEKLV